MAVFFISYYSGLIGNNIFHVCSHWVLNLVLFLCWDVPKLRRVRRSLLPLHLPLPLPLLPLPWRFFPLGPFAFAPWLGVTPASDPPPSLFFALLFRAAFILRYESAMGHACCMIV